MWWILSSASLAGALKGPTRHEFTLPWGDVGLSPAIPEQAAYGPDLLALGPDDAWAIWDPVRSVLRGSFGSILSGPVTGLAFAADGDLITINDGQRQIRRYEGQMLLAEGAIHPLCPIGGRLVVEGDEALMLDAFGNAHPAATLPAQGLDAARGPHLRAPRHKARLDRGRLQVDGRRVHLGDDLVAVLLLGDQLLVEHGARGAITGRGLYPLKAGSSPQQELRLPGPSSVYRPAAPVAVGPDGRVGWLDPQADGLHIVMVRP